MNPLTRTYSRPDLITNSSKLIAVVAILFLSACATIGRDFPLSRVAEIQIGKTTQAEIQAIFGSPWRTGIEDDMHTWTYGKYHYSAFGETTTQDLLIRFNSSNVVKSYTFNTTDVKK